jgi:hypothetical protein
MAEEQKQPEGVKFKWAKPTVPTPQIYTNYVHASWTLFDVRFLFGQLIPTGPGESNDFIVEEQGSLVVAWPEAKALRNMLIDLVARFEKTNGEIQILKLPPNTPMQEPATEPKP